MVSIPFMGKAQASASQRSPREAVNKVSIPFMGKALDGICVAIVHTPTGTVSIPFMGKAPKQKGRRTMTKRQVSIPFMGKAQQYFVVISFDSTNSCDYIFL